jgi:hypothetical protein
MFTRAREGDAELPVPGLEGSSNEDPIPQQGVERMMDQLNTFSSLSYMQNDGPAEYFLLPLI